MKIKIFKSLILLVFFTFKTYAASSFEDQKNEFGFYFGAKLYEERHPVDNSFFMSQDGWMLGLIGNNETYSNDIYTGFKYQIGYGEVEIFCWYRKNGRNTRLSIRGNRLYRFTT